jgi:DNA ligase-associated metallophosphoesterase
MKNAPEGIAVVEILGEVVWLLPDRAVFWSARRWLWVADLHWGKDATFRAAGIPLPIGGLAADLQRLGHLIEQLQPERLLLLGDLIHARASLHPQVIEEVAHWRSHHRIPFTLVEGNHDRHAKVLPAEWGIARGDSCLAESPFVFQHAPGEVEGAFVWCGHVHPVHRLGFGKQTWRLPCFHLGERLGILPAFGEFTGGVKAPYPGIPYIICDGRVEACG